MVTHVGQFLCMRCFRYKPFHSRFSFQGFFFIAFLPVVEKKSESFQISTLQLKADSWDYFHVWLTCWWYTASFKYSIVHNNDNPHLWPVNHKRRSETVEVHRQRVEAASFFQLDAAMALTKTFPPVFCFCLYCLNFYFKLITSCVKCSFIYLSSC